MTIRILLVGLLSTGLFTPGFCIGLGGTLLSLLLMEAGRRSQLFSPCGIGILGAAAHNTGQILTAAALAAKHRFIFPAAPTAAVSAVLRSADRRCHRQSITNAAAVPALNSPILHFY
ncbi:MAG: Gx transporter family protein [Acidaminococcaceae bacterium]|nr:Gx transporter family protein [Acidaminococcaceae bacterium]